MQHHGAANGQRALGPGMTALLTQMAARGVTKTQIGPGGQLVGSQGACSMLPLPGPPCMGMQGACVGQGMLSPMGACGVTNSSCLALPGPPAAGRPVFLAPATAHIQPVSGKPKATNQLAAEFVQASKERQAEMLKDPTFSRAILQSLADNSGGARVAPVVDEAAEKALWTGMLTLTRNGSKKLPARVALHHGKMQDIMVAVRTAAGNSSLLDIKHRVPFDEVARRISTGTVLSLDPRTPTEQRSFDDYIAYFKTKARAGVARLDDGLALYVMPAGESPEVLKSLYELNTHIPRNGSLLGIIGTAGNTVSSAGEKKAEPVKEAAASEVAPAGEGDGAGENISSKELMDLFSNPDLIKLLSDKDGEDKGN
ncbi:unnamed protein product [Symbiodinium natans]|uniref:Spen paralogue and orthologue SPOC C-terminal domain-containing protein n=1 Tax=Symbiodinium natans TaxID=878477 RepID=A0A812IMF7_9DINO|nr:unnamed protein product [Symbiodinium natans]